jgi:hypothetical protein
MQTLIIPITGVTLANADIVIPTAYARKIAVAYKFTGSDGAVAAAYLALTVDDKGDGNASGAGHIKLQADGKKVRVGDGLDARNSLILCYEAVGECVVT